MYALEDSFAPRMRVVRSYNNIQPLHLVRQIQQHHPANSHPTHASLFIQEQEVSSFLLPRPNNPGVEPGQVVVNRILLLILRSLFHAHTIKSALYPSFPATIPSLSERIALSQSPFSSRADSPAYPYKSSAASPAPGIPLHYSLLRPSMLINA